MVRLEVRGSIGFWTAVAACAAAVWLGGGPAHAAGGATLCDYGIACALHGQVAPAETAFVAMLSESLGDPRAWNNLANLRAIQGRYDEALVLYARALRQDTLEAGVVLNRALVLSLMERDELSSAEYRRGVALAGGSAAAETLLGLRPDDSGKAFDFSASFVIPAPGKRRAFGSRDVRMRLAEADTSALHARHVAGGGGAGGGHVSGARSAATDESNPARLFYWKR